MKVKRKKVMCRTIAFVSALTIIASATMITGFADKKTEVVNHVDNYTGLMPGLISSKMQLSDPQFSTKEWYEYIEYEDTVLAEVVDGNVTYRIYQPVDYSKSSIMAIGDYNPKEVSGNSTNLSINLGELQGIFEMAAQGSNISKEYAGMEIADTIAENMNNISEVMDNSKYYIDSSFLGIPNDKKYKGVSNDGYFNADSLEIEIAQTEVVTAGKTVAVDSAYTVSEGYAESKDYATYIETLSSVEKQTGNSSTSGTAISDATSKTSEISGSVSKAVGYEIMNSLMTSHTDSGNVGSSHSSSFRHLSTHKEGSSETTEKEQDYIDDAIDEISNSSLGEMIFGINPLPGALLKTISDKTGIEGLEVEGVGVDIAQNNDTQTNYEEDITENEYQFSHESYSERGWSNGVSNTFSVGSTNTDIYESGQSEAVSSEHSITKNVENTKSDLTSIGNALTNGENTITGKQNQKNMAVDLGYGVDYQVGNETQNMIAVTRIFNAREDEKVRNVGWKLCEYVVKIPYYIEAVKTDATGEENILYGQYVNYNLLNGVCRVFANGYIEHWYTGELVAYADFFDGFVTATELVDIAKAQQAKKADMLN